MKGSLMLIKETTGLGSLPANCWVVGAVVSGSVVQPTAVAARVGTDHAYKMAVGLFGGRSFVEVAAMVSPIATNQIDITGLGSDVIVVMV